MISILTATIGRNVLHDLFISLANQVSPNWEWVVVFDGNCSYNRYFSDYINLYKTSSGKIKISIEETPHNFGRPQRKAAVSIMSGGFGMYVDDDDILYPHAISTLEKYIKYHDFIIFRTWCDWLGRSIPASLHLPKITCGEVASCSYAVSNELLKALPWPQQTGREVGGTAADYYWFREMKKLAKRPVVIPDVLAYARHYYVERGCEPSWVSRFGH